MSHEPRPFFNLHRFGYLRSGNLELTQPPGSCRRLLAPLQYKSSLADSTLFDQTPQTQAESSTQIS